MSYVSVVPETMAAVANDVASIGSALSAANAAAAAPTTSVLTAAADEISTQISAIFGAHAQGYQTLSAQAAAFHDQFVRSLTGGGNLYTAAEAASAAPLQPV